MTARAANLLPTATPVRIPVGDIALPGNPATPSRAVGLVIFVHGSGSSRFSPRNMHTAAELNRHGLATLLLDLLTHEEQRQLETSSCGLIGFPFPFGPINLVQRGNDLACGHGALADHISDTNNANQDPVLDYRQTSHLGLRHL